MTDLLRTMLAERADALAGVPLDVDRIEADGRRRVRRRRLAGVVGTAVLTVVVGLAVTLPRGTDRPSVTAHDAIPLDTLTWAAGSTLHSGDTTVRLGRDVGAMVQTAAGVVYTSGDAVWEWTPGGQRRLGRVAPAVRDGYLLKTDPGGTTVAWVDTTQSTRLGVLDVASGDVRHGGRIAASTSSVRSVADGEVILATAGRIDLVDAASLRVVRTWPGVAVERVLDVRAGWFLTATPESDETRQGAVLSHSPREPGRFFDAVWSSGTLSPSATRLFSEDVDDDTTVVDVAMGRAFAVVHRGFYFAAAYRWLDDDRFLALGIRREGQRTFSLLTCSATRATCRPAVPDIGTIADVAVPFGLDISDD